MSIHIGIELTFNRNKWSITSNFSIAWVVVRDEQWVGRSELEMLQHGKITHYAQTPISMLT